MGGGAIEYQSSTRLPRAELLFHPRAEPHMGMPATRANWTVDMLDALPDDGQRYEIIDGELFVTPAPSDVHQLVAATFYRRLHDYLRPGRIARAMISPADVRRGDRSRNRVQPDVFAVRLHDGARPAYPYSLSDLLLAVEVESPGNSPYDYHDKRELYLSSEVPEYWVVHTEARVVSRWRPGDDRGEVLSRETDWRAAGMPAPLTIDLPELFRDALE